MKPTTLLSLVELTNNQLEKLRGVSSMLDVHVIENASVDRISEELRAKVEIVLGTSSAINNPSRLPNLKWIQAQSAGINRLADKQIWQSDVILTKASGIHATPISERVMAMMFAFRAHLPFMWQVGRWPEDRWEEFHQPTLRGSTLGIIGYGAIGAELGRQADALGMCVLAMNRSGERQPIKTYAEPGIGDPEMRIPEKVYSQDQLLEMLPECDHVVALVPLTDETYHMFGAAAFRCMKNTAYFYNFGRGQVVDESAMILALQNGQIAGAGLDVFETEPLPDDSPLWTMTNVIITPHVGGLSVDYNDRLVDLFVVNLKKYLAGQPLINVVDRNSGY